MPSMFQAILKTAFYQDHSKKVQSSWAVLLCALRLNIQIETFASEATLGHGFDYHQFSAGCSAPHTIIIYFCYGDTLESMK